MELFKCFKPRVINFDCINGQHYPEWVHLFHSNLRYEPNSLTLNSFTLGKKITVTPQLLPVYVPFLTKERNTFILSSINNNNGLDKLSPNTILVMKATASSLVSSVLSLVPLFVGHILCPKVEIRMN